MAEPSNAARSKRRQRRDLREDEEKPQVTSSTVHQPSPQQVQHQLLERLGEDQEKGEEEERSRRRIIRLTGSSQMERQGVAAVVGVGPGLGFSIARRFAHEGYTVAILARNSDRLEKFVKEIADKETKAQLFAIRIDCSDPKEVKEAFESVRSLGFVEVLVYNVLPGMIEKRKGTVLFTGASASIKGLAGSAELACGKFALRALSQCLAREYQPQGIHVAHVIVDGIISSKRRMDADDGPSLMSPDAIAEVYWQLHMQDRSAWAQELDLRPFCQKF